MLMSYCSFPNKSEKISKHDDFYPCDVYVSAVLAMATWLAVWLSDTRQYCIRTAETIFKIFWPSGSRFTLVCAVTQFQGEPFSRGYKYTGVGKIEDFRLKLPFISETVRDRPMVTTEVMGAWLNDIIFDDLDWPLTRISRSDIFRHWISQKRHEIEP